MMEPRETVTLHFDNAAHQELHRVLMDFDFTFQVRGDLSVGRIYNHPTKPVRVELKDVFGDLESVCFDTRTDTLYDGYSGAESDWLTADDLTEAEVLRRELHILIKVRPNSMNTMITERKPTSRKRRLVK